MADRLRWRQSMPAMGFVDHAVAGVVSGWCTAPRVSVTVNGKFRDLVECNQSRPDVQAAGHSRDGCVGFQAPLSLNSGDVVRVFTEDGQPLRHSPKCYFDTADTDWLSHVTAQNNPEYNDIAALRAIYPFTRFRPLFGHMGQRVSTAVLDIPGIGSCVASLDVSPQAALSLQHFHKVVLVPERIASPGLVGVVSQGKHYVLLYDYARGSTLDALGPGWEAWVSPIASELMRLQSSGQVLKSALTKPRGGKPSALSHFLKRALADALLGKAKGERRFLLWLLATVRRLPRVLSHGDLHRDNVLVDTASGEVALIDWDRWGYLPIGFDLALLMRGLSGVTAERLAGGDRIHRLGIVGFTYLFQRLDRPDFTGSQEALALQRRCRELAGALSTQAE